MSNAMYDTAVRQVNRLEALYAASVAETLRLRTLLEELVDARAAYDRSLQTGTEKQTIRTEKRLFQAWDNARAALALHRKGGT